MQVIYRENKPVSASKLDRITNAVGWGARGDKWGKILDTSSYVITACKGEEIVGLGRIVDDGVMCMVYDLAVHPKHQGEKIGSEIMSLLIAYIEKGNFQSVGLFAWNKDPTNIQFYKKFGFKQVDFGMKFISH